VSAARVVSEARVVSAAPFLAVSCTSAAAEHRRMSHNPATRTIFPCSAASASAGEPAAYAVTSEATGAIVRVRADS
jgi:hypothetical protein